MQYRKYGRSGRLVSEIGMGGHREGVDTGTGIACNARFFLSSQDRARVVGRAIDQGVTYFDTTYGCEIASLGEYLRLLKRREGLFISGMSVDFFANLLDNSVAHTPAGAKVTVAAGRADEDRIVEVTVTDAGVGIPSEDLPRIFERFYQVDKARKRRRGAGLGLAITKEIVEAHGGTITAESVEGLGSKFTVRLPVH